MESSNNKLEPIIKVIGVGGGGGNAVSHMAVNDIEGVQFIVANTDSQALNQLNVKDKIQLGVGITGGLGAGANPEVGKQAATENEEMIKDFLKGANMVFVTCGMGGGTGTGAAPVVAEIAKSLGVLTVGVVTKPFKFEGKTREKHASEGIKELSNHVDSLIVIPNEKLSEVLGKKINLFEAFSVANDVLFNAVQGIAEIITKPGIINVDFNDLKTIMNNSGQSMMGIGIAKGEDRAQKAAQLAIESPLLEDTNLSGAKGIIINVTSGFDLDLGEFEEVGDIVKGIASSEANIIAGTSVDENIEQGEIRVTIVATGLSSDLKDNIKEEEHSIPNFNHLKNRKFFQEVSNISTNSADILTKKTDILEKNEKESKEEDSHNDKHKEEDNKSDNNSFEIPSFLKKHIK